MDGPETPTDWLKSALFNAADQMGVDRGTIAKQLNTLGKSPMVLWQFLLDAEDKDDPKTYFRACLRKPAEVDRDGLFRKLDGMPDDAVFVRSTNTDRRKRYWRVPGRGEVEVDA